MYNIKAPVSNYNGVTAGVQFANGVGSTEDPHVAEWMEQKGYTVTKVPRKNSKPKDDDAGDGDKEGGEA